MKARSLGTHGALLVLFGLSLALPGFVVLTRLGLATETFVRIARPWTTPIAPLAVGIVAQRLLRWPGTRSRARTIAVEALAGSTALLLALVVAGVEVGRVLDRMTVILLVDRSRSTELVPRADEIAHDASADAVVSMREDDRIGTVVFGATAVTEDPPHTRRDRSASQRAQVGRDATDIDAAIRRALAEAPADSAARIVLVSDGVSTRGDALAAASAALAAQVPIDVVVLEQRRAPNVRVVSVAAPPRAAEGETIDLRVVTSAPVDTPVELLVKRDGAIVSREDGTLRAGEDVLRIREKLEGAGLHRYEVEIAPRDPSIDSTTADNAGSAFVRVRGEASALVLEADVGEGAFISSALRKAGFRVDEGGELSVPSDLAGLASYDLVIVSDIAASRLSPGQIDALATYARDLGGGLLLMGGDRSFGPGGYGKTSVEEVSPVSFDIKNEKRRASLAEVIGIDISGSMGASVGDKNKLDLANEAAARSAALLGPGDLLGVEHVDTLVHWSVPLGPIADQAAVDRAIRSVQVGGGGIIVPITLEAGYAALDRLSGPTAVNLKHLLLFADGSDAEEIEGALALAIPARGRGITTSVVALGTGKDIGALEQLSRLGGGRFYLIEDATRLPAVFAQETILASRSALVEKPFLVAPGASSPVTRGIDLGQAPHLDGYVVTIPKGRASVLLTGPEGDPILATWSVGLGRTGAFTSDLKSRWGRAWTTWPGAARLVAQLGRDLARAEEDPHVRLSADASGGELHLRATVVGDDGRSQAFRRLTAHVGGPDGFSRDIPLEAIGAGSYAALVPLSRQGVYIGVARDDATGEVLGTTGAVLSAGEELRPTGSDRALLERIASFTGGKVRTSLHGVFDDRASPRRGYVDASRWLVLASALALLGSVAARRLALPKIVEPIRRWVGATLTKARELPENEARAHAQRTVSALLEAKARAAEAPTRDALEPIATPREPAVPSSPVAPTATAVSPRRRAPAEAESPSTGPARDDAPKAKLSTAEILLAKKRKK